MAAVAPTAPSHGPGLGRLLLCLVVGQGLALLNCATGVFATLLADRGVRIPTTQSLLNYFLLLLVYGPALFCRKGFKPRLPWWVYFLVAVADVEGNFLVVKAYQYTDMVSVQLLDCFSIPCVMVLSHLLLQARFARSHFWGVLLCLSGLCLLLYSDYSSRTAPTTSTPSAPQPNGTAVLGDVLCLAGAACYAVSNVGQEWTLKCAAEDATPGPLPGLDADDTDDSSAAAAAAGDEAWRRQAEFLAMLGVFGTPVSLAQLLLLERSELRSALDSVDSVGYLLGFGVALFLLYSLVPRFLLMSNATFMNISLIATDFYAVLANVLLMHVWPAALFYVAFVAVILGLLVYNVPTGR